MATTPTTLFEDLKKALADFKKFLDDNVGTIKPAIAALRTIVPQISDLLTKLIDLMTKIKAEVDKLAATPIPGIDKVATFTSSIKTLLQSAEGLLPDEKSTIDDVLQVTDVVTGIPSVAQIQKEIDDLLDAIIAHLKNLSS
jgi:phage-related protein